MVEAWERPWNVELDSDKLDTAELDRSIKRLEQAMTIKPVKTWEHQYLALIERILETGEERMERTGTGTLSVFSAHLDINLAEGFPAVTTKKLAFKAMLSELLFFIEGSSDENRLKELVGSDNTIWSGNANAPYWKPKAKFPGDLGRIYGVQWRNWKTYTEIPGEEGMFEVGGVDQLMNLVEGIRHDPTSRRLILSALNVGEFDQMSLPPCPVLAQFYVSGNGKLSCQVYQRSADVMLGVPFNVASFATLTHMLAQTSGLDVGMLHFTFGDAHLYSNHLDGAREQITRTPTAPPELLIGRVSNIEKFQMTDFYLKNYNPQAQIKMEMAV